MSIATQISRIKGLRNRIKSRLITLGVLSDNNADLSACTTAIENIQGTNPQWHINTESVINYDSGTRYFKIPIPTISSLRNIKMICLKCAPNYNSDNKFLLYTDYNHITYDPTSAVIEGRTAQGNPIWSNTPIFMAEDSGTGLNYLYIEYHYSTSDSYTATYIYVDDEIPSPSRNNTNTL